MRWLCLVLALSIFNPVFAAENKQDFKNSLIQFEGLCLKNGNNFGAISSIVEMIPKSKQLTENQINSLGSSLTGGIGYSFSMNNERFMVVFNEKACGMAMRGNDADKFKKELTTNFKLKKINRESEGYQIVEMYEFTNKSIYSGGILSLVYPKNNEKDNILMLNFIPEQFVKEILQKTRSSRGGNP